MPQAAIATDTFLRFHSSSFQVQVALDEPIHERDPQSEGAFEHPGERLCEKVLLR